MIGRARSILLRTFGALPVFVRVAVVRLVAPSFRVGAMCVIGRGDGAVLLVRHSYRRGWGFPGGLLKRGEEPAAAARREAGEELGVTVELDGEAKVVVDARYRRVDVIYRARILGGAAADAAAPAPQSPEILEARWFSLDALPRLGREAVSALEELSELSPG